MSTKKLPHILLIILVFLLTITGCTTPRRPNPQNNTTPNQNVRDDTNLTQPNVKNNTTVNDNTTKNNIMPGVPQPTTPNSTVGFTLDEINEFDLDIELTNKDKVDMKYKKDSSNGKSTIETRFNGKVEKTENAEASREIEKLLRQIPGASLSETNKIIDGTLSALNIKREDVTEFDMEFKFEGGEKVDIEFNKSPGK